MIVLLSQLTLVAANALCKPPDFARLVAAAASAHSTCFAASAAACLPKSRAAWASAKAIAALSASVRASKACCNTVRSFSLDLNAWRARNGPQCGLCQRLDVQLCCRVFCCKAVVARQRLQGKGCNRRSTAVHVQDMGQGDTD